MKENNHELPKKSDTDLLNVSLFNVNDLTKAIEEDKIDEVNNLLDLDIDINKKDAKGFTPLGMAIKFGRSEIVNLLIENGADVDVKCAETYEHLEEEEWELDFSDNDYTPLGAAIIYNHTQIMRILLSNHATCDARLLERAVDRNRQEIVKTLLEINDPEYIFDYSAALNKAIEKGFVEVAECFLKRNIEVNVNFADEEDAIRGYEMVGNIKMIQLLLNYESISLDQKYPSGDYAHDQIKDNLPDGIESPYDELNLLQIATRGHLLETVKFLLDEKGLSLDENLNLIHCAVMGDTTIFMYDITMEENMLSMVNFLLDKGLNFSRVDPKGFMPIHYAAMYCGAEMLEYFLDRGFDINDTSAPHGNSLLHLAAGKTNTKVIDYLLSKEANINIQNSDGQFPVDLIFQQFIANTDHDSIMAGITLILEGADLTNAIGGVVAKKDTLAQHFSLSLPQKIVLFANMYHASRNENVYNELLGSCDLLKQKIMTEPFMKRGQLTMCEEMKKLLSKIKVNENSKHKHVIEELKDVINNPEIQKEYDNNLAILKEVMTINTDRDITKELFSYLTDVDDDYIMSKILPQVPKEIKTSVLEKIHRQDLKNAVDRLSSQARKRLRDEKDEGELPSKKEVNTNLDNTKDLLDITTQLESLNPRIKAYGDPNISKAFASFLSTFIPEADVLIAGNTEAEDSIKNCTINCLGQEEGSLT